MLEKTKSHWVRYAKSQLKYAKKLIEQWFDHRENQLHIAWQKVGMVEMIIYMYNVPRSDKLSIALDDIRSTLYSIIKSLPEQTVDMRVPPKYVVIRRNDTGVIAEKNVK